MNSSILRSRLAPTPSGFLHIGNAFSFVVTALATRAQQGRLLLRIDDMDQGRKRPEYVEDIFRSLDWLGIECEEGPTGPDHFEAEFSQRHRLERYREAFQQLRKGPFLYECWCSRKELQAQLRSGVNTCPCQRSIALKKEGPSSWKVKTRSEEPVRWEDGYMGVQAHALHKSMPNFIIQKKDGMPAYQLCSLVDDLHFGITYIVRGEDLLPSTAAQLWLAQLLSESSFAHIQFVHHPLLRDKKANKLSKSEGALSLKSIRGKWKDPAPLYRLFSRWLELPDRAETISDMIPLFKQAYLSTER